MDAIVIACATRNHVNYLNNLSASKNAKISRTDMRNLLCDKKKTNDGKNYVWLIRKPWPAFTQDARKALLDIVVSFKQNLRVINKSSNNYQCYDEQGKKILKKQIHGDN